jgi:hypothetical protein
MVEPDAFSTGAVAIATVALAIITYFYMRETRLIRVIGQKPNFSLEPYGSNLVGLYIINSGQHASDIFIDCTGGKFSQKFHILSLGRDTRALLYNVPIAELIDRGDLPFLILPLRYDVAATSNISLIGIVSKTLLPLMSETVLSTFDQVNTKSICVLNR